MTHAVTGIQPGWRVHDREGVDLGAVTRLDDRSVWITRGRIFRHEVEIPRVAGHRGGRRSRPARGLRRRRSGADPGRQPPRIEYVHRHRGRVVPLGGGPDRSSCRRLAALRSGQQLEELGQLRLVRAHDEQHLDRWGTRTTAAAASRTGPPRGPGSRSTGGPSVTTVTCLPAMVAGVRTGSRSWRMRSVSSSWKSATSAPATRIANRSPIGGLRRRSRRPRSSRHRWSCRARPRAPRAPRCSPPGPDRRDRRSTRSRRRVHVHDHLGVARRRPG